MKVTQSNLFPNIPISLSFIVGDIIIRFGGLERVLFTALARVKQKDEGEIDDDQYFLELVGEHKDSPMGKLIEKGREQFKDHHFDWIDFDKLYDLKEQRNFIHDALIETSNGELRWQASGKKRKHRPMDYTELLLFREAIERTFLEIHEGSLEYKTGKRK